MFFAKLIELKRYLQYLNWKCAFGADNNWGLIPIVINRCRWGVGSLHVYIGIVECKISFPFYCKLHFLPCYFEKVEDWKHNQCVTTFKFYTLSR